MPRKRRPPKKTFVSSTIQVKPNASASLEDTAFSTDHILRLILGNLDRGVLLNIRLVSRRWAIFGAKALQKIVTIRFIQPEPFHRSGAFKPSNIYHVDFDPNRSIQDLVPVMNASAEFPSASFSFLNRRDAKVNQTIQHFLNAHGVSIKKLRFDGDLHLDDLKRILLTQAPNLEKLLLVRIHVFLNRNSSHKTVESPLERAEQQNYLFDADLTHRSKPILKNLKAFKCPSVLPDTFLNQLLECCPNLDEIFLPPQSFHCLAEPVNRFHLVKKLMIAFDEYNIDPLELVTSPYCHTFKCRVEELVFYGHNVYDDADFYARMVTIMRRITLVIANTCRKLVWSTLLEDFEFPEMPGVKQFIVTFDQSDDPILPGDVSLKDKFPNLESLVIRSQMDMEELCLRELCIHELCIDDILGSEDLSPPDKTQQSVKNVSLNFIPAQDFRESCRVMFPNATISTFNDLESENDDDSFRLSFFDD